VVYRRFTKRQRLDYIGDNDSVADPFR